MEKAATETWSLEHEGHLHQVEVTGTLRRTCTWRIDGEQVAQKSTNEENLVLAHPQEADQEADQEAADDLTPADRPDAVKVRFPKRLGTAKRVTLIEATERAKASDRARLTSDGIDFEPEAGTKAAARQEWIRRHPTLHTVRETLVAGAGVLIPLAILALLKFVPLPDIDLPAIPWPDIDLPSIPWPSTPWPEINLPSIPWPSIPWPDWTLPGWLVWILDNLHYIIPVILAAAYARGEVKRRRAKDAASGEVTTHAAKPTDGADPADQQSYPEDPRRQ